MRQVGEDTLLSDAVTVVCAALTRAGRSTVTVRQRRWALEHMGRAVAVRLLAGPAPTAAAVHALDAQQVADLAGTVRVRDVLDTTQVGLFFAWMDAGLLTVRERPLSVAGRRACAVAVRSLARTAGLTGAGTGVAVGSAPAVREPLAGPVVGVVRGVFAGPARGVNPTAAMVRNAAMWTVQAVAPRPTRAFLAMRVGDVDGEGRPSRVRDTDGGWVGVDGFTGAALLEWLWVRERLVAGLAGGGHDWLWVSTRAVPSPSGVWAAGLPLRARGLQRAFAHAAEVYNASRPDLQASPAVPGSFAWVARSLAVARAGDAGGR